MDGGAQLPVEDGYQFLTTATNVDSQQEKLQQKLDQLKVIDKNEVDGDGEGEGEEADRNEHEDEFERGQTLGIDRPDPSPSPEADRIHNPRSFLQEELVPPFEVDEMVNNVMNARDVDENFMPQKVELYSPASCPSYVSSSMPKVSTVNIEFEGESVSLDDCRGESCPPDVDLELEDGECDDDKRVLPESEELRGGSCPIDHVTSDLTNLDVRGESCPSAVQLDLDKLGAPPITITLQLQLAELAPLSGRRPQLAAALRRCGAGDKIRSDVASGCARVERGGCAAGCAAGGGASCGAGSAAYLLRSK